MNISTRNTGNLYAKIIPSPLGEIQLIEQDGQLIALNIGHFDQAELGSTPLLKEVEHQLAEYFAGTRTHFTLPLAPQGTAFQQKVWKALQTIPYGQVISYKTLAEKVDSPKGYRAVGGANGKNPIPIIIPCHRVVAADGKLGGFSLGLPMKIQLLTLEGYYE